MKIIIVGPPFVGKSTLVNFLRQNRPQLKIKELDELLIEANNGTWPHDEKIRNQILLPQVLNKILTEDIIFFTSYICPEKIIDAHRLGFKIIQLFLPAAELKKRNINHDRSREIEMTKNIIYQNEIWEQKLIDYRIIANLPTPQLAEKIEKYLYRT